MKMKDAQVERFAPAFIDMMLCSKKIKAPRHNPHCDLGAILILHDKKRTIAIMHQQDSTLQHKNHRRWLLHPRQRMSDDLNKRADQRPNDEERDEEKEDRVAFNDHADVSQAGRQKRKEDMRAVQGRQRHEVENGKDDIYHDDIIGYPDERRREWHKTNEHAKDDGDEKIACRTSGGDE